MLKERFESEYRAWQAESDPKAREDLRLLLVRALASVSYRPDGAAGHAQVVKYVGLLAPSSQDLLRRDSVRKQLAIDVGADEMVKCLEDEGRRLEVCYAKYAKLYEVDTQAALAFGVDRADAPTWTDIEARLTPGMVNLIERIAEVRVIAWKASRQELITALDSRIGRFGIGSEAYVANLGDERLWNDGEPEIVDTWQVMFVDGRQEVPYDAAAQQDKTAREQVLALRAKYQAQGLDVLRGAQAYIALLMQRLAEGGRVDRDFWTVLNTGVVTKDEKALLGCGYWAYARVYLGGVSPDFQYIPVRLRAAVRVNL